VSQTSSYSAEVDSSTDYHVEINNLLKEYRDNSEGSVIAVEDVDINIKEGEFLVLVGPSGCGKTTTLRCVAGLETATEGEIIIGGEDVTGLDPRERDIAMVFQNYALYPHKTVQENLAFPLQIRKVSEDDIDERVSETAEILSITDLLDRKPKELSGGQQQRVALGRAIIRNASVFLLDEPLSNLDAKLRAQMRTELNKLHKQIGKTTIYVTHDQAEAMTLGDRIAVLNDGELQQVGVPEEIYDAPVNKFVAGFIGEPSMNFIPVTLSKDNTGWRLESDMFDLSIPDEVACEHDISDWEGRDLTLGIRPENLHDERLIEEPRGEDVTFGAHAKVIEPLGADKYLTFTDERQESGTEFTARISPDSPVTEGERLNILVDMDSIHLFDDRTGENLTLTGDQPESGR